MKHDNPFKPTFGFDPPLLVDRDDQIDDFVDAIEGGAGSPGRATLYTGARGEGKTVMLNAVQAEAERLGWLVISETATPGFVERIVRQHLPDLLRAFDLKTVQTRLTGITGPLNLGGATWETTQRHIVEAGLRNQLELLTDLLRPNRTGVLISVDEIHYTQVAELRELAATVQHAFREARDVAFVGAGLPSAVSDLLNDEVLTFLRRAERHELTAVRTDEDVRRALRVPIAEAGRVVGDAALGVMADATQGYPFMIQLVGYNAWRATADKPEISIEDARRGVERARRRLGALVHAPELARLSGVDRLFLDAMARDDGPSAIGDIQARLGKGHEYVSVYRRRLIDAGLIAGSGRGQVDFTLPYMRDYLREQRSTER